MFDPRLWLGLALLLAAVGDLRFAGPAEQALWPMQDFGGCAIAFETQAPEASTLYAQVTGSFRLLGEPAAAQGLVLDGSGNLVRGSRVQALLPGRAFRLEAGAFIARTGRRPLEMRILTHTLLTANRILCR